jgi:hypothetical protein
VGKQGLTRQSLAAKQFKQGLDLFELVKISFFLYI